MRWTHLNTGRGRSAAVSKLLIVSGLLGWVGCAAHTDDSGDPKAVAALAALMADGPLPPTMQAGTPTTSQPARFCGFDSMGGGGKDAGVGVPVMGGFGGPVGAGGTSSSSSGMGGT